MISDDASVGEVIEQMCAGAESLLAGWGSYALSSHPAQITPGDDPLVLVATSTAQDPHHGLLRAASNPPRMRPAFSSPM